MSPNELGNKLETVILTANNALSRGVLGVQDYLYTHLIKTLKDLELDENGAILQNANNRKVIDRAVQVIDERIQTSQYQNYVEKYLGTFDAIDTVNITYFEILSDAFKPNRQFLASLQKQTVSDIESLLFNSGWESQIKIPLSQILNQNINSGGSFTGMLDQVKTYVKGNLKIEGRLLSYTKQITKDALFNYSRAFQKAVTEDLGLVWYAFSGGLMKDSRPWCVEHAGGYYHRDEIISWVNIDWKGKRPDTTESSIFIYCSGYNCTHSLIPVDISVVPQSDIDSAIENGFYKPS